MSTTTTNKSRARKVSEEKKVALETEPESTEPQDHPFASIFDPWLKQTEMSWVSSRNANAFSQASAAGVKGMMELFQESGRFMSERMKKDMATMKALTECRNGEDYYRVQADFFDGMVRDYADEMAKVTHLAADATHCACKPLEDRTKEALHSIAAIPEENGNFA